MEADGSCSICGHNDWRPVSRKLFERRAMETDQYTRRRAQVLFELWAPGSELELVYSVCKRCGFVCYFPRPSEEDLQNKYTFLNEEHAKRRAQAGASGARKTSTAGGSSGPPTPKVTSISKRRSEHFYKLLQPYLGENSRILDFGGGRGVLLQKFAEAGFDCNVVDYVKSTISGVRRLGTTLDDLSPDENFDFAMCSHVFEHLADPGLVVSQLRDVLLARRGLLFIEVPMELKRRPPRQRAPVTHINFFCESSLSVLLESRGFKVLFCRQEKSILESGETEICVRALAQVAHHRRKGMLPGADYAMKLMGNPRLAAESSKSPKSPKSPTSATSSPASSLTSRRQRVFRSLRRRARRKLRDWANQI